MSQAGTITSIASSTLAAVSAMFLCPVGASPATELLRGADQAGAHRRPRRRDGRRLVKPSYDHNAALAKTFVEALNRRDLDDFLSVLADDVELRTFKGVKRGRRAAAEWFDRPLDHLKLEFTDVNLIVAGNRVVGTGTARFTWKETGDVAEETAGSAVWEIEDGLVRRWEAFSDYTDALRRAGVLPEAA